MPSPSDYGLDCETVFGGTPDDLPPPQPVLRVTQDQLDWLNCLLADYERLRGLYPDEDENPSATDDMLCAVTALASLLKAHVNPEEREPEAPPASPVVESDIPF